MKNVKKIYSKGFLFYKSTVIPSQPGVGQLTPSNFIALATTTAALCCSIVPPFSRTLILFLFAIGHPEALQKFQQCKQRAISITKFPYS
jgi:hypothetical protein